MVCPYCRSEVEDSAGSKTCEGCNTPHHQECFDENGGCTLFGCEFAPPDEPKIQVTQGEAAVFGASAMSQLPQFPNIPHRPATGFGDMSASFRLPARAAEPAQQMGRVPPPPRVSEPATAAVSTALAAAPSRVDVSHPASFAANGSATRGYITPGGIFDTPSQSAPVRRSRLVYILLGIFLGAAGAHNFYAGFYKRAVVQLCLTVLTLFYGSLITAIWAIVEVCTVDRDANRVEFS